MSRKHVWALAACAALLTRPSAAQLFEPPQGLARELADNNVHVRLPLAPLANASLTSAATLRVETNKLVVDRLTSGFTTTLSSDTLDVGVVPSTIKLPGTYTVVVEVHGEVAAVKQKQRVELVLTLPSSKLRPIPPVLLLSEHWPEGGKPSNVVLHLETDPSSPGVTAVAITQPTPTMLGDTPTASAFKPISKELKPDTAEHVTLESDGPFPIGTTKGVLQIESNRLAERVLVPFEVRTKVPTIAIAIWFAIWAALGILIRGRLRGRLARGDALLALKPLVARARNQIESHPALETRAKLVPLLATLEAAVDAKQSTESASKALLDAVAAAEATRASWLSFQVEELSRAAESLLLPWSLPGALDLATPAAALEAAANAAMADDPDGSKQQRASAISSLHALTDGLRAFAQNALHRLSLLQAPGASLPHAQQVFDATADARKELGQIPTWNPSQPLAVVEQLPRAHRANADLLGVVQGLRGGFHDATKAALLALTGQSADLLAELEQAASIPAPDEHDAVAQLAQVQDAAKAFAQRLGSFVTDNAAKATLAGGAYVAAIEQQLAANAAAQRGQGPRDKRDQVSAGKVTPALSLPLPASAKDRGPDLAAAKNYAVSIRSLDTEVAAAEREQPLLRCVTGIVAASLAALLAWLAFRRMWVGTVEDFAMIAALGFFTDFTLDSVLSAAQKLKPST